MINGYHTHVILGVPGAAQRNVPEILKRWLLNWQPPPWQDPESKSIQLTRIGDTGSWMRQIQEVFWHEHLKPNGFTLRYPLSEQEAEQLLQRLIKELPVWSKILKSPKFKHVPNLGFDGEDPSVFVDELCAALGDTILVALPTGHVAMDAIEAQLRDFHATGFSVVSAVVGWLYQRPEALSELTALFEKALTANDDTELLRATQAVEGWHRGARAKLVPALPDSLLDLVIARIVVRKEQGLDDAINCVVALLKMDIAILSPGRENLLLLALECFEHETSPQLLRKRYNEEQIGRADVLGGLNIRRWAGRLARAIADARMKRSETIPPVLNRWERICANDPLPEVRQAWRVED